MDVTASVLDTRSRVGLLILGGLVFGVQGVE